MYYKTMGKNLILELRVAPNKYMEIPPQPTC